MNGARGFSNLSRALQPGERIVWQGTPDPWIAARQFAFPLLFMTLWTGGVLYGLWNLSHKPDVNPNGVGFPLIILSFFFAFGAYSWLQALRAVIACWTTGYALTDRRVIIAAGETAIQSFNTAALGDISRTGNDARGTLRFGSVQNLYGRRSWNFGSSDDLYGIGEPARVEALIYQTLIMPKKEGASR